MPQIIKCTMQLAKETRGALKYAQIGQSNLANIDPSSSGDDAGLIGTLYVRKKHIEGKPVTMTVTVEVA